MSISKYNTNLQVAFKTVRADTICADEMEDTGMIIKVLVRGKKELHKTFF